MKYHFVFNLILVLFLGTLYSCSQKGKEIHGTITKYGFSYSFTSSSDGIIKKRKAFLLELEEYPGKIFLIPLQVASEFSLYKELEQSERNGKIPRMSIDYFESPKGKIRIYARYKAFYGNTFYVSELIGIGPSAEHNHRQWKDILSVIKRTQPGVISAISLVSVLIIFAFIVRNNFYNRKKRRALNESITGNVENYANVIPDLTHPLYGVKGWLDFFVVVNRSIIPIVFVISNIFIWIGYSEISKNYPNIIIVGLVDTFIQGFFVWKWMQIALHIREIRVGAIGEAKVWLLISLGWAFLSVPIDFLSGIDSKNLLPGIIKGTLSSLAAFFIWYNYFNFSKRVKVTFKDWNKKISLTQRIEKNH